MSLFAQDIETRRAIWEKRRVLVTGSSGFIGSWLVGQLREWRATTIGLVRDRKTEWGFHAEWPIRPNLVAIGSVEDFECLLHALNEYEIDTVFHLAARTVVGDAYSSPMPTFETNIRGTWNILEASRQVKSIRCVVVASSDKAYGEHDAPCTEDMALKGSFPYDVSKSCADLIAQSYFKTYELPVCIVRNCNVFGGGDLQLSRVVPATIVSVLQNKAPRIHGSGEERREFLYSVDAVLGYLRIAEAMADHEILGHAFNVSDGIPRSVLDVMKYVLKSMGRPDIAPVILGQDLREITVQSLDPTKAKEMLGWLPTVSFERGLQETIAWYMQYFKEIVKAGFLDRWPRPRSTTPSESTKRNSAPSL